MNKRHFKSAWFIVLLMFTLTSYGQFKIIEDEKINNYLISKLDSMGIDKNVALNRYEADYFNAKYEGQRKNLDFNGKKVAFFKGSSGGVLSDKEDYFVVERRRCQQDLYSNSCSFMIFDEDQKAKSGGYDIAFVYWAKAIRSKDYYVKKLSRIKE